jgi:general secretion pathway protein F
VALFRYSAIDPAVRTVRGEMEAATEAEVVSHLQGSGHLPMRANLARGSLSRLLNREIGRRGMGRQEVADFTRELSIMLGAGQDLDRSLRFLVETAPSARVRTTVEAVRQTVRDGGSLAAALAAHPTSFARLTIGLVRAGEAGGTLAPTLDRLALLMERQRALASTIQSALIYPGLLLVAAIGSITLLLTQVLPQFVPLFEQNGAALPRPTQLLILAGDLLAAYGLLALAVLAAIGLALGQMLARPGPRLAFDRVVLRVPVIGGLLREVMAARLTRTLGTLLLNGVPLITALGIAQDAIGNRAGVAALEHATLGAKGGDALARTLEVSGIFPPRTIHLLRLGEETAQLGAMSLRAADIHEEKSRLGVQRLVALLVPAITIVMGLAIAAIVSALLLAMLGLNDLAQ